MSPAVFSLEKFHETYADLEPLYREHYAEMQTRLAGEGVRIAAYNPRLDEYVKAAQAGWLLTFVARIDGKAVGYCNIYLSNDMHNGEPIAQEDAIFVTKAHRTGIGRALTKFLLEELRRRGVKRGYITAVTDLRVGKAWARMGFKAIGEVMVYRFDQEPVDVRA